jgi:hypothetical protein
LNKLRIQAMRNEAATSGMDEGGLAASALSMDGAS